MKAKKEAEAAVDPIADDDNIDKVRDILFGVQVREFERRFSKLEEKFSKELENLREDTASRLLKLEEFMSKEISSLQERIYEEQDSRTDSLKAVTADLQNTAHALEKQISKLGEKTTKNESEIRTQLLDQSKTLTDTIQKKQDDIMTALEKESKELRDDKTDRAALADLFKEMAMRLTGDFKLPESK
ncbi:MAG: hypothetical protein R2684_11955 [Pyrinomonadaceae bacterium]